MQPFRVWTHTAFAEQALAAFDPTTTVIYGSSRDAGWHDVAATCDALILDGITLMDGGGIDRINVPDATERGILVINTPDGPTESTAEHAIALMLSLTKRVAVGDRTL